MSNPFTPEEVSQILEAFFAAVGTRQYIGARYVPIFGRKDETSIIWDNSAPYEPLTIVLYQGNSFTSRQYVPAGVEITNQEFWANTGNYNAQVEQYRQEVAAFDARITQNTTDISTLLPKSAFSDTNTVKNYIDTNVSTLNDNIDASSDAITDVIGTRFTAESTITDFADSVDETLSTYQDKMLVIGDSYSSHELSGDQQNDSSLWWYLVANKLNLTPTVFAKSGAGYVHASDGITFDTLATNAINSITDKDEYRYVFVYGGLNDLRLDVPNATFQTAVQALLPKIANAFPKSTVIVMGCNTFVNQNINANNATQTTFSHILSTICVATGCTFINTNTWLLGWTSQFNSAEHPNQFGEARISSLVLMHMFGSSSNTGIQEGSFTSNANWSTENVSSIQINNSLFTNELMFWNMTLVTSAVPTSDTKPVVHLPWNMSTGITNATTQTIVPITMRNGNNFYNDFFGQLNKNTLTINAQSWPSVSGQCFFYLDFTSPMNY